MLFDNASANSVHTVKVIFEKNHADVYGNAIFSESFSACRLHCFNTSHNEIPAENIFNCTGDFTFIGNNEKVSIATSSARKFDFHESNSCSNKSVTICELLDVEKNHSDRFACKAIPGEEVCLPFDVLDDFNKIIHPLLGISHAKKRGVKHLKVNVSEPYSLNNLIRPVGFGKRSSRFTCSVIIVRQIYFFFKIFLVKLPICFYSEPPGCCWSVTCNTSTSKTHI